jgi:hypothetical protein
MQYRSMHVQLHTILAAAAAAACSRISATCMVDKLKVSIVINGNLPTAALSHLIMHRVYLLSLLSSLVTTPAQQHTRCVRNSAVRTLTVVCLNKALVHLKGHVCTLI